MSADAERRGSRLVRLAQLLLLIGAIGLWVASRLTWVSLESSDGLGQPRSVTLNGSTWAGALVPLAVLLVAAALAALAVRGWPLRALAVLLAVVSAAIAYPGISQWVVPDNADMQVRAADLAQVPVATLVATSRSYPGAGLTVAVAVLTLAAAVMLIRAAGTGGSAAGRYRTPAARRAQAQDAGQDSGREVSERDLWDALDSGQDPTDDQPGSTSEGR